MNRLNVSMDTLRQDRFATITRRDRLSDVLDGLAAARDAGLDPVKINTVLLRGVNDDEAVRPAARSPSSTATSCGSSSRCRWTPSTAGSAPRWSPRARSWSCCGDRFTLTPDPTERGGAPAERWLVDGGPAVVGVIASVTRPFCGACDRTRLTADGQVRSCLFARTETDLRAMLRGGAPDAEIADVWRHAMWGKLAGHGIDDPGFLQPDRPMSAIGG